MRPPVAHRSRLLSCNYRTIKSVRRLCRYITPDTPCSDVYRCSLPHKIRAAWLSSCERNRRYLSKYLLVSVFMCVSVHYWAVCVLRHSSCHLEVKASSPRFQSAFQWLESSASRRRMPPISVSLLEALSGQPFAAISISTWLLISGRCLFRRLDSVWTSILAIIQSF